MTRCYCCGQEHDHATGQCYACSTKHYCLCCLRIESCGCGRKMGYHKKCGK